MSRPCGSLLWSKRPPATSASSEGLGRTSTSHNRHTQPARSARTSWAFRDVQHTSWAFRDVHAQVCHHPHDNQNHCTSSVVSSGGGDDDDCWDRKLSTSAASGSGWDMATHPRPAGTASSPKRQKVGYLGRNSNPKVVTNLAKLETACERLGSQVQTMTKMAADIEYGATEEEQWDMISKLMSTSTKAIQPHVSMIQSALKKLCNEGYTK